MFCQAGLAGAEEHQLTEVNLSSDVLCCFFAQPLRSIHLMQVHHGTAVVTDEMHMGGGVGIEPLNPVYSAKALNNALLFEPGKISVDRCQGDVRVVCLEHFMHHLC